MAVYHYKVIHMKSSKSEFAYELACMEMQTRLAWLCTAYYDERTLEDIVTLLWHTQGYLLRLPKIRPYDDKKEN
jgi:hypothetical protein